MAEAVHEGKTVHFVVRRHDPVLERTLPSRTDTLHFVIRAKHQSTLLFVIIVIINLILRVVKVGIDRIFVSAPFLVANAIFTCSIMRRDWHGIQGAWWH